MWSPAEGLNSWSQDQELHWDWELDTLQTLQILFYVQHFENYFNNTVFPIPPKAVLIKMIQYPPTSFNGRLYSWPICQGHSVCLLIFIISTTCESNAYTLSKWTRATEECKRKIGEMESCCTCSWATGFPDETIYLGNLSVNVFPLAGDLDTFKDLRAGFSDKSQQLILFQHFFSIVCLLILAPSAWVWAEVAGLRGSSVQRCAQRRLGVPNLGPSWVSSKGLFVAGTC